MEFIKFYEWYTNLGGIIENKDLDKVVEKFITK